MRISGLSTVSILVGLGLGVYSGMQALESTGLEKVSGNGGWQEWRLGENDRSLPYALGHFLSAGQVPPPRDARYFVRSLDDDGNALTGDCVFKIEGPEIASRWWSLRAGENATSILTAGQALVSDMGQLNVMLSPHPMPGNWILPPSSTRYTLTYVINQPAPSKNGAGLILPSVKKAGC
jgi:hypothetical protein